MRGRGCAERKATYDGFCEVLAVDEDVDRVEVGAGAAVEGDLVHDLPVWRGGSARAGKRVGLEGAPSTRVSMRAPPAFLKEQERRIRWRTVMRPWKALSMADNDGPSAGGGG